MVLLFIITVIWVGIFCQELPNPRKKAGDLEFLKWPELLRPFDSPPCNQARAGVI
jgi:hypothetical protein